MAKKYALVPESWLEMRGKPEQESSTSAVVSVRDRQKGLNSEMLELLPKNLRNKARILLHYLDGKIKLDDRERIVYGDGHVGSYLLDLVRYYVSPLVKTRPLDAPRFDQVLSDIGVPSSAIARPNLASAAQSDDLLSRWISY